MLLMLVCFGSNQPEICCMLLMLLFFVSPKPSCILTLQQAFIILLQVPLHLHACDFSFADAFTSPFSFHFFSLRITYVHSDSDEVQNLMQLLLHTSYTVVYCPRFQIACLSDI